MFPMRISVIRIVKWCLYLFIAVFLVFVSFAFKVINKTCSYSEAENLLLNLCSQYHRHEIDGNMCGTLCDKKELALDYCANNFGRTGRKDVLVMKCNGCGIVNSGSKLVLKHNVIKSVWGTVTKDVFGNSASNEHILNRTEKFVASKIREFDLNLFTTAEDILSGLLGEHYRRKLTSSLNSMATFISLKTAIALTMQKDFITFLAFQKLAVVPRFYGHCGPAYFQENTQSLSSLGYIATYDTFDTKSSEFFNGQRRTYSWTDRARLAIRFLDLLRRLEIPFKTPLQICDLKTHNIGLNGENKLVFLDCDDCAFDHRIRGGPCQTNGECDYIRCGGICNEREKRCYNKRKNNNIQIACQFLFIGEPELLGIHSPGLLRSPPEVVREELNDILQRCAFPFKYNVSTRTDPSGFSSMNRLKNFLIKTIDAS